MVQSGVGKGALWLGKGGKGSTVKKEGWMGSRAKSCRQPAGAKGERIGIPTESDMSDVDRVR